MSICYAHIPKQRKRKMINIVTKAHLIGYDNDRDERYRLWIRKTNSVICSRDVRFNEKTINSRKVVQLLIINEDKMTCEYKNQGNSEERPAKRMMNALILIQVIK